MVSPVSETTTSPGAMPSSTKRPRSSVVTLGPSVMLRVTPGSGSPVARSRTAPASVAVVMTGGGGAGGVKR